MDNLSFQFSSFSLNTMGLSAPEPQKEEGRKENDSDEEKFQISNPQKVKELSKKINSSFPSQNSSIAEKKMIRLEKNTSIRTGFLLEESNDSLEIAKQDGENLIEDVLTSKWKSINKSQSPVSSTNCHKVGLSQQYRLGSVLNQTDIQKNREPINSNSHLACEPLGLELPKSPFHLQTHAFHELKLKNLVVSHSEKLERIPFQEKNLNPVPIECLTFRDPANQQLHFTMGEVDPSFLELQQMDKILGRIGGAFVNNYPVVDSVGQINCDAFHSRIYSEQCGFSIIADGCGWGNKSRQAAQRAVAAAAQYIHQRLKNPIDTAQTLACVLIHSLAMAHDAILSDKQEAYEAGTTTMNICIAFKSSQGKKYLLTVGVGDCKTFIVTKDLKDGYYAQEMMTATRLSFDAKDPGGRLGPYVGEKNIDPDLRNLSVCCVALPEENCIILNMTDGVHDNLNPEQLGKDFKEVAKEVVVDPGKLEELLSSKITSWSELSHELRLKLGVSYQDKILSHLISEAMSKPHADLNTICERITAYCQKITSADREFMESNPRAKEPTDKKNYPGKMDHCTVVAFRF